MKKLDSRWALGSTVVDRILPHGAGFRMVDGIADFEPEQLRIRAFVHISSSHPVFAHHFSERPLWPGVYTLEGMAQTVIIAIALRDLVTLAEADGADHRLVTDALRALDDRSALRPVTTGPALDRLEGLMTARTARIGMVAAAQTRWERPVPPGVRLDYEATVTYAAGGTYRATAEARVDGRRVASATLTTVDAPP